MVFLRSDGASTSREVDKPMTLLAACQPGQNTTVQSGKNNQNKKLGCAAVMFKDQQPERQHEYQSAVNL